MTSPRSISGGKVLCLLSTSDSNPHPIVTALTELGADVEIVGDVYRGLARWGSKNRSTVAAAVVDVDRVDASEMEFFDLAARYRRNVPILVFARSAESPKLQQALLRGARTAVDLTSLVAQVSRILEPAPVSRSESDQAGGEPEPPAHAIDHDLERRLAGAVDSQDEVAESVDVGLADETPAPGNDRDAATAQVTEQDAASEPETSRDPGVERVSPDDDVDGKERSARVPWRRYADRPQRKPPPRTAPPPRIEPPPRAEEPPTRTRPSPNSPDAAGREEPPLLTPEELDALIGGRISPNTSNDADRTERESPREGS